MQHTFIIAKFVPIMMKLIVCWWEVGVSCCFCIFAVVSSVKVCCWVSACSVLCKHCVFIYSCKFLSVQS